MSASGPPKTDRGSKRHRGGSQQAAGVPPSAVLTPPTEFAAKRKSEKLAKASADLLVSGLAANAVATARFSGLAFGDLDLTLCLRALNDTVDQGGKVGGTALV